jgi:hypothetical protein
MKIKNGSHRNETDAIHINENGKYVFTLSFTSVFAFFSKAYFTASMLLADAAIFNKQSPFCKEGENIILAIFNESRPTAYNKNIISFSADLHRPQNQWLLHVRANTLRFPSDCSKQLQRELPTHPDFISIFIFRAKKQKKANT